MALDFLAGCLGGCAGVAVGHPLDTVKVRLQTQDARNPLYRGTWHCLSATVRQESVRGLYKGMSSPMAGVALVNSIVFGVHGNIMKNISDPDSLTSHLVSGCAAGFCQSVISSPMELLKTRVQLQTEAVAPGARNSKQNGPLDCLRNIYSTEGIRGLFRGQMITVMRDVPAFGSYFVSYEWMSRSFAGAKGDLSAAAVLTAGGMAGIVSWVMTYPIDVLKSRLQADGMSGQPKYKGIIHCLKTSIASEGMRFLSKGMTSTIVRAYPTNAATFAVVTWTLRTCHPEQDAAIEDQRATWLEVLQLKTDRILNNHAVSITNVGAYKLPLLSLHSTNFDKHQHLTVGSFLPEVMSWMADNHMEEPSEEEAKDKTRPRSAIKKRICSCSTNHSPSSSLSVLLGTTLWSHQCDQILSCTRASFRNLVARHQALSTAL